MKKVIRITAIVLLIILGYMVITDAIGRWFGLWKIREIFSLGYILLFPLLVYLAIDKKSITINSNKNV